MGFLDGTQVPQGAFPGRRQRGRLLPAMLRLEREERAGGPTCPQMGDVEVREAYHPLFLGEGALRVPTKIDYREKVGALFLTFLLENLGTEARFSGSFSVRVLRHHSFV